MTVNEKTANRITAMRTTIPREGRGAFNIRIYSTWPESPRLNTRPKIVPFMIAINILTRTSR